MLEINPLVVTRDGNLVALDAKMSLRRERAVPPPGNLRTARQVAGRSARDLRHRPRPVLCRPRRQYRLHHQWRRPRHGDDGHDQDRRRRTGELPRHRRRRLARAGGQGVPRGAAATRMSRRSSSTSSPASTAATGWPRASSRRSTSRRRDPAGRAAGRHQRRGGPADPANPAAHIIVADTLAEAADKAVAAWPRRRKRAKGGKHGHSARREHPRHRPGLHRQDRHASTPRT